MKKESQSIVHPPGREPLSGQVRGVLEALGASLRREGIGNQTEVVVAYSGGVDSVALLWALGRLPKSRRPRVEAIHVDHGLRQESREDAERAMEVVASMGLRGRILTVRCEGEGGVEAQARRARYRALASSAEGRPILTAHTADDQAETVLYRLSKGAGLAGARGILPAAKIHGASLLRPLLCVRRDQLEEVVRYAHLPVIEDPSNQTRLYVRNRLRLDVLPGLEAAIPGAASGLARAASLAAKDEAYLSKRASNARRRLEQGGEIDSIRLSQLPFALSSRIVRELVREVGEIVPTAEQIERILALEGREGEIHLEGGWVARNRSGVFLVEEGGRKPVPERKEGRPHRNGSISTENLHREGTKAGEEELR